MESDWKSSPPPSFDMHDAFAALLRQPTARRYTQLRSLLLARGLPADFSVQLAGIQCLLSDPDLADYDVSHASELLRGLSQSGLLSLRWHRLGGQVALQLGERNRAELHRFAYDALCEAIASTGHGTRHQPLLITYCSDASELLATQGCQVLSQSIVEVDARRFDVLLCQGEREFWFDVSDLLPQTAVKADRGRSPKTGAAAHTRRKQAASRR